MKVSITFDKEVKDSNKKQWVREIQTVVDKLNSRNKESHLRVDSRPELPRERLRIPSSDKKLQEKSIEAIQKSSVSAQIHRKEVWPTHRAQSNPARD